MKPFSKSKFSAENDLFILEACRRGNQDAWETLMHRYDRLLYYIARRYGATHEDAFDIVQTTFTYLLESVDAFDESSNIKGWLKTVAQRQTWRLMNRRNREDVSAVEDVSETGIVQAGSISLDFETNEQAQVVRRAMLALNEACYVLLYDLYFAPDKPSYEQISSQIGIPKGSIGPTRARCLQKLKQILQDQS